MCQFQHDLNQNGEEDQKLANPKGFTIVRKKQVIYKCGNCEFRSNNIEVVRKHTTNEHKGNNGDTMEHEDKVDKEETHSENDEDVHDSVTAYLKVYRKKKKESDKVSGSGGPRAQSPGFHKL